MKPYCLGFFDGDNNIDFGKFINLDQVVSYEVKKDETIKDEMCYYIVFKMTDGSTQITQLMDAHDIDEITFKGFGK